MIKSIRVHLSPGSEVIPNNDIHDNVSAYSFGQKYVNSHIQ